MENLLAIHEGIVLKRKSGNGSLSLKVASLGVVLQARKTPKDQIFTPGRRGSAWVRLLVSRRHMSAKYEKN